MGQGSSASAPAIYAAAPLRRAPAAERRLSYQSVFGDRAMRCARRDLDANPYERPALLKLRAALPADSNVAFASAAVIATVVSISQSEPPPAAAKTAEAAIRLSGNSPMTNQS